MPWIFAYSRVLLDFSLGGVVAGFLWHCTLHRQWSWLRGPLGVALVLWLAWMGGVVSPLASGRPWYSLAYAVGWLRYPLLFVALSEWLLLLPRWRKALWISLAVVMGVVWLETVVQLLHGTSLSGRPLFDGRLTGPLTHPNVASLIARLGFALAALTVVLQPACLRRRIVRLGIVVATASLFVLILASGERSTTFLLLTSLLLMGALALWRYPRCRVQLAAAFALCLTLGYALFALYPYAQSRLNLLWHQLADFEHTEYAALYRAGWNMLRESPIHGIGLRHFRGLCERYMQADMRAACAIHPHNYLLEWAVESGMVGMLVFCFLAAVCLRDLWQPRMRWRASPARHYPATVTYCLAAGSAWLAFFPFVPSQGNWNGWNVALIWLMLGTTFAACKGTVSAHPAESDTAQV